MGWIRLALLVLFYVTPGWMFRCGEDQLQQCQMTAALEMGRDDSALSWRDLNDHCKAVRSSMDCLINHSTSCLSDSQRDRIESSSLKEIRHHLSKTCEYEEKVDENWIDTPCFHGDAMEQCEKKYKSDIERLPQDASRYTLCRYYSPYKQCVQRAMEEHCSQLEASFMNTYLLDRAGELAWRCPDESQDGYLRDQSSSSSVIGGLMESFKGIQCLQKIKEIYEKCTDEFDKKQTSIRKVVSQETKEQKLCCAFGDYSHCVQEEARKKCSKEGQEFVTKTLKKVEEAIGRQCHEFYPGSPKCSGSFSGSSVLMAVTAVLAAMTTWWLH